MKRHVSILLLGIAFAAGCNDAPPPRSVISFVENPMLLEAAIVRCARDRELSRNDLECANAREAARILEAREDALRRADAEAESERKREALRRSQDAAAARQREAAEAQRRQEEAEYLSQFGVEATDASAGETQDALPAGNAPIAVVPAAEEDAPVADPVGDALPAVDGGNAPGAEQEPAAEPNGD